MSREPDAIALTGSAAESPRLQVSGRHAPDRFVEIGSVTKTFTALLLQVLVDDGAVDPADLVSTHLPVDRESGITVDQLAAHSSGLRRLPPGTRPWSRDPYARFDEAQLSEVIRDLGRWTEAEPGEATSYSNLGYAVLAAVLESVAGKSWIQALTDRVVAPLRLPDPVLLSTQVPEERRLHALGRWRRHRSTWTFDAMGPAGGLWTTPRSLGSYVRAVLIDEAFGPVRWAWHRSDGMLWHNGATRDAATFAGARPAEGRWAIAHGLGVDPDEIDALGVREIATNPEDRR